MPPPPSLYLDPKLGLILVDEGHHHLRLVVDGQDDLVAAGVAQSLNLVHNHRLKTCGGGRKPY